MVIYENPFKIHLPHDYEILDRFQEFSKEAIQMLLTLELLGSASESGFAHSRFLTHHSLHQ